MDSKRILYVEGNADGTIGGSFFSLLFLVKNLDRLRFSPIVVFSTNNSLIPRFEAAGAEVHVRPLARPVVWPGLLRPFSRAANLLLGLVMEPLRLARLLRVQGIDLVHLNNSIERNHSWIIAARLAGIPCVTHERGMNARISPLAKLLAKRLAGIICISGAVRDNLVRLGVDPSDLTTIWNGLDPAEMKVGLERNAVLAEFGLESSVRLIGMVGNVRAWKGQAVVVEAMEQVARSFPDVVCLLIGDYSERDLSYRRQVESEIANRGLKRRVIVTGYRPNVADYVSALDVLIHASILPEPFGRVLLEGMALCRPLVASRGGAVPEIVDEGVTGLLFEPGDPRDLADKLGTLLAAPESARAMGQAGRARLERLFGISTNASRTMAIYERVLA